MDYSREVYVFMCKIFFMFYILFVSSLSVDTMMSYEDSSRLFLLTGCLKVLLRHTPASSSVFQGQDNFPVTVSTRKVAEQRSLKTVFSYD